MTYSSNIIAISIPTVQELMDEIVSHHANCDFCQHDSEAPPSAPRSATKNTAGASANKDASISPEKAHKCHDMGKLIQDHEWHLFETNDGHSEALALRPDGRLLSMTAKHYRDLNTSRPEQLRAYTSGEAAQLSERDSALHEERRSLKRCRECGKFCNLLTKDKKQKAAVPNTCVKENLEASQAAPSPPQPALETSLKAVPSIHYSNTEEVFHLDPPCYCRACSDNFWAPDGFLSIDDHKTAASTASHSVSNIEQKSKSIAEALRAHEHTLRHRWKKKNPSQREATSKRAGSKTFLTYRDLAALLHDFYPRRRPGQMALVGEIDITAVAFILDDLVEDPDLLFEHCKARSSKHASDFFLSSLIKAKDTLALARTCTKYYSGSFSIGDDSYGVWEEWNETRIHEFKTVATSVALSVFVGQGAIYDLLAGAILELCHDLEEREA